MTNPTKFPTQKPTPEPTMKPTASAAIMGDVFGSSTTVAVEPKPAPTSKPAAFQKPSGGGKSKPSGGKNGSTAKGKETAEKGTTTTTAVAAAKPTTNGAKVPVFQSSPPTSQPTKATSAPTMNAPTSRPFTGTAAGELVGIAISLEFTPPTLKPTMAMKDEYVELSDQSSAKISSVTDDPTPRPTPDPIKKGTSNQSKNSPATADTSATTTTTEYVPENEYSCTGEPCQEAAWCRSRYGSCGPGFIYCNTYSTWKSSCPATSRQRPTKTPTRRPTRKPAVSAKFVAHSTSKDTPVTLPPVVVPNLGGLPTLPKPTLPHITKDIASKNAANYYEQSSFAYSDAGHTTSIYSSSSIETTDGKDEEDEKDDDDVAKIFLKDQDDDEDSNDEDVGDKEENGSKDKGKNTAGSETENDARMDIWLDFTASVRSDGTAAYLYGRRPGNNIMVAGFTIAVSLSSLIFI